MSTNSPKRPILFFADALAIKMHRSTDSILLWRKKLNVGTKYGTVWIFTAKEADQIEAAIKNSKRGWPAGRTREGQGSGRRWTQSQRDRYQSTIKRRRLDARKQSGV